MTAHEVRVGKRENAPRMPRRADGGRWGADARRKWRAWAGRVDAMNDDVAAALLETLVARADEAERAESQSMRLKLSKEARLIEQQLLRLSERSPEQPAVSVAELRQRAKDAYERHNTRTEFVLADLDHSVWPGYDPGETENVTQGRYELAPLNEGALTEAQLAQLERWDAKQEAWHAENVAPHREAARERREKEQRRR